MSAVAEFSPTLFVPVSKIIITASISYGAIQVLRGRTSGEEVLLGAIIGLLGITFFDGYFDVLSNISRALEEFVRSSGDGDSIYLVIKRSLESLGPVPGPTDIGITDPIGAIGNHNAGTMGTMIQAGVWGVIRLVIEFVFIVLSGALETVSLSLLQIVKLLFPISAALALLSPGIMKNMALYAVELSLWKPFLTIIRAVTGFVAKQFISGQFESHSMPLGLSMLIVQLSTIFLFLKVPSFVHSFTRGQFAGDHGLAPLGLINTSVAFVNAKAVAAKNLASSISGKGARNFVLAIMVVGLTLPNLAAAEGNQPITLYPGFVTKIRCQGRLLVSAVGNEELVERSALPSEIGCGLILKPGSKSGQTNLIIETTTGSVSRTLVVTHSGSIQPHLETEIQVRGEP